MFPPSSDSRSKEHELDGRLYGHACFAAKKLEEEMVSRTTNEQLVNQTHKEKYYKYTKTNWV
eukprot:m.109381 g.109381  ORF g.109381 m.109381 type:complete len:62 (+) comp15244_c0_seq3:109-294(+)